MLGYFKKIIRRAVFRIRNEVPTELLVERGLVVGRNFQREKDCIIDPSHCWLITIGDNVTLAPRVHILAHDASMHGFLGVTLIRPVTIGDNVFIGAESVILPGVTVGHDVIIGAGSVVTKNVPDGTVVAGNPARVLAATADFLEKHKAFIAGSRVFGEKYTLRNKSFDAEMRKEMKDHFLDHDRGYVE